MADPKVENPVRLDPWQSIVDVHWKSPDDPTLVQYCIITAEFRPTPKSIGGVQGYADGGTFFPQYPNYPGGNYTTVTNMGLECALDIPPFSQNWFRDVGFFDYQGAFIEGGAAADIGAAVSITGTRPDIDFSPGATNAFYTENNPFSNAHWRNPSPHPDPPNFLDRYTVGGGEFYFAVQFCSGAEEKYHPVGTDPGYWQAYWPLGDFGEVLATDFANFCSVEYGNRTFTPTGRAWNSTDFSYNKFTVELLLKSDRPRRT